jgi:hypothetical protein
MTTQNDSNERNSHSVAASRTPKAWGTKDADLTPKQREALEKDAALRAKMAEEQAKKNKRKGGGRR